MRKHAISLACALAAMPLAAFAQDTQPMTAEDAPPATAAEESDRLDAASVNDAAFVIDLPDLGGAAKLKAEGVAVSALIDFAGH